MEETGKNFIEILDKLDESNRWATGIVHVVAHGGEGVDRREAQEAICVLERILWDQKKVIDRLSEALQIK